MLINENGKYVIVSENSSTEKSWEEKKTIRTEVAFVTGLSKMKFMGTRYSYDEKNLRL